MNTVGCSSPSANGRPRPAGVVVLCGLLLVLALVVPPFLGLLTVVYALVLACTVFRTFAEVVAKATELAQPSSTRGPPA